MEANTFPRWTPPSCRDFYKNQPQFLVLWTNPSKLPATLSTLIPPKYGSHFMIAELSSQICNLTTPLYHLPPSWGNPVTVNASACLNLAAVHPSEGIKGLLILQWEKKKVINIWGTNMEDWIFDSSQTSWWFFSPPPWKNMYKSHWMISSIIGVKTTKSLKPPPSWKVSKGLSSLALEVWFSPKNQMHFCMCTHTWHDNLRWGFCE